jgi:cytoskeletal protein CcmA (bactofilin family)
MKNENKIASISTFLGFGSRIEGSLEFQGTIRLDGQVKGQIASKGGTLIVGERAVIEADIIVDTVIIMGEISGTIDAKERIEVHPTGRLSGDIQAGVISIEAGGLFNGKCAMRTKTDSLKKSVASTPNLSISELPKGE